MDFRVVHVQSLPIPLQLFSAKRILFFKNKKKKRAAQPEHETAH
jgi:hypothetical protein